MLAHGKDVNVLNDDHFVVALVKDGIIEDVYFFFQLEINSASRLLLP